MGQQTPRLYIYLPDGHPLPFIIRIIIFANRLRKFPPPLLPRNEKKILILVSLLIFFSLSPSLSTAACQESVIGYPSIFFPFVDRIFDIYSNLLNFEISFIIFVCTLILRIYIFSLQKFWIRILILFSIINT